MVGSRRYDYQQSVFETFSYDALDRFDQSMRNGATNLDVAYDAVGNLSSKSDLGSYG